jgi:adenosylcobinamide-GDP ribazoletransferase
VKSLICALSFLTPIPVSTAKLDKSEFSKSLAWFSLVGVMQGVLVSLVFVGLSKIFSGLAVLVLTVAFWAVVTSGMHLDGLADCFDGFFAIATREKRLEIMKDPRVGTFGFMGLIFVILIKVSLVGSIVFENIWSLSPFFLAIVYARSSALVLVFFRNARSQGLGFGMSSTKPIIPFALNMIIPVALCIYFGWLAVFAFVAAFAASLLVGLLALSKISGVTGDVFGMAIELSEIAVLLTFALKLVM